MKFDTIVSHAGLCSDEKTGSISTPIYQTATFRHVALGVSTGFDYTRTSNPTRKVLEDVIAKLEEGDGGFAFASGMASINAIIMMFSSNSHFIISDDLYGGTYRIFEKNFKQFGIEASFIDTTNINEIKNNIRQNTKAIFIETPSNPIMKITDLEEVNKIAKQNNLIFIVDNTFMTPALQKPIKFGADIVIHSGTKYLAGHNDVLCGFIVTRTKELSEKIGFIQNSIGGVLSPMDSFLTLRGIKTLSIRIERQEKNAIKIVEFLQNHKNIKEVFYPGIKNYSGYEINKKQSLGFGGMISFKVKDSILVEKIINNVKVISFAESLGGVELLFL